MISIYKSRHLLPSLFKSFSLHPLSVIRINYPRPLIGLLPVRFCSIPFYSTRFLASRLTRFSLQLLSIAYPMLAVVRLPPLLSQSAYPFSATPCLSTHVPVSVLERPFRVATPCLCFAHLYFVLVTSHIHPSIHSSCKQFGCLPTQKMYLHVINGNSPPSILLLSRD